MKQWYRSRRRALLPRCGFRAKLWQVLAPAPNETCERLIGVRPTDVDEGRSAVRVFGVARTGDQSLRNPPSDTAVVAARPASVLAEGIRPVPTLRGRSFRNCGILRFHGTMDADTIRVAVVLCEEPDYVKWM
jgi:hypothetical protein